MTNVEIPITNPDDLWKNPAFNHEWPLVIFVTGWKTNLMEGASKAQDVMAEAYLCRGNVNFVVMFLLLSDYIILRISLHLIKYEIVFFFYQTVDTG